MHIFFFARGIQQQVDIWKTLMQCHFWQWEIKDMDKNENILISFQGALRPSILGCYEYTFPEPCLPNVLSILGTLENDEDNLDGTRGHTFKMGIVRKLMGCEKIPKSAWEEAKTINPTINILNSRRALYHNRIPGVSIHIIGIKKDEFKEFKVQDTNGKSIRLWQEAL